MKKLHFLVIGKNQEILDTLKRLIVQKNGWQATVSNDEAFCLAYLMSYPADIVLLSSGLDITFEQAIKELVVGLDRPIKIIEHYGGGSGLLKNEVYQLFPELHQP